MNPRKNEVDVKGRLEFEIKESKDLCSKGRWQEAIDRLRVLGSNFKSEGFPDYRFLALREVDRILEEWRSNIARRYSAIDLAVPSTAVGTVIENLEKIREDARLTKSDLILKDIDKKIEFIKLNSKRIDIQGKLDVVPQPSKFIDPDATLHQLENLENETRALLGGITVRISAMRAYKQLTTLFKTSRRISIEDFCKAINMDLEKALPLIYDMAMKLNFIIDGRFMELKGDDLEATISQIDSLFSDWLSREKLRSGKI